MLIFFYILFSKVNTYVVNSLLRGWLFDNYLSTILCMNNHTGDYYKLYLLLLNSKFTCCIDKPAYVFTILCSIDGSI